jgi:hypothetical protein
LISSLENPGHPSNGPLNTSCIKQMPRISVRVFAITSISNLFLNRNPSFSFGTEPTEFGLFFSHAYF